MAVRKIITIGDEGLRKKARPIEKFDERLHTLLDDMAETMYEADGAGIAAPQVGILRQAIVIDSGGDDQSTLELINPEIIESEGSQINPEGCLSVPGKRMTVERPTRIRVRAQDRFGNHFELEGEEFFAIVISHETDHLSGILYVDKMIEDVTEQYQSEGEVDE